MNSRGGAVEQVDWTVRLEQFRGAPRDVVLSDPYPAPDPLGGQVLCTVFEPPAGALEAGDGSGWDDLALLALGPSEQAAWRALGGPKRRRDWLLGRIAAKDAVRLHLRATRGVRLTPADVVIGADAWGRPLPGGGLLAPHDGSISVSLSHTDGIAMALAVEPPCGAGIDVERLGRRRGDYAEAAFTPAELALIDLGGPERRAERALRLWCSKEAVAKALGRGLMGNPMNLEARDADAGMTRISLGVAGALASTFPDRVGRPLTAFVSIAGDLVVAAALDAYQPMP
ncbi:MAG TPA: 4'-phosphopantetheinyl transferase superfamily protein [Patescibacteria group bacterium]|nr:4'-phosphopantetheinyl transferase superfamily protein [Patescibacteria group bacterium]